MYPHLRLILILFFGLSAAIAFSVAIQRGHQRFQAHKFKRMRQIFSDTTYYDVLYLGSSRTHTTIYPSKIDSITGLKSYNAGMEGGNLFEFKTALEGFLEHHPPPKLVILTLDAQSFDITNKLFFPLQYFESIQNAVLADALKQTKDYNLFLVRSVKPARIIYFDDYAKSQAIKGLLGSNEYEENQAFEDQGFLSNGYKCLSDTSKKIMSTSVKISDDGKKCLEEIIGLCNKLGIKLIFTYAPEYKYMLQRSIIDFNKFIRVVDSMRGGIPFYRDDSLQMCKVACNFTNYGHVNTWGAIEYSKILGERLKESFK